MIDLDQYDLRTLQKECARAVATMEATNNNIYKFNQQAHHDSQNWYKAVIEWYIDQYGDLPSRTGPGSTVKIILDNV
jgi:hypothetical protein